MKISKKNVFEESGYYTWMYAGNMLWSNIATGAVVALVIGFTLLPIWPDAAKKVLWYCSVTFIICTLSFCIVRGLAFLIMWLMGYEFWVFPRLFDESVSVMHVILSFDSNIVFVTPLLPIPLFLSIFPVIVPQQHYCYCYCCQH